VADVALSSVDVPHASHEAKHMNLLAGRPEAGISPTELIVCAMPRHVSAAAALCRETKSAIGSATAVGSVVTEK
jgi:hypothetical protein